MVPDLVGVDPASSTSTFGPASATWARSSGSRSRSTRICVVNDVIWLVEGGSGPPARLLIELVDLLLQCGDLVVQGTHANAGDVGQVVLVRLDVRVDALGRERRIRALGAERDAPALTVEGGIHAGCVRKLAQRLPVDGVALHHLALRRDDAFFRRLRDDDLSDRGVGLLLVARPGVRGRDREHGDHHDDPGAPPEDPQVLAQIDGSLGRDLEHGRHVKAPPCRLRGPDLRTDSPNATGRQTASADTSERVRSPTLDGIRPCVQRLIARCATRSARSLATRVPVPLTSASLRRASVAAARKSVA